MRLSKRLARTGKRYTQLPPPAQLRREAKVLREIAPDDPKVKAVCDAFEKVDGYLRIGGPDEPKRAEPLPEWKKPPPETP